jgi:hypothetical protein
MRQKEGLGFINVDNKTIIMVESNLDQDDILVHRREIDIIALSLTFSQSFEKQISNINFKYQCG